MALGCHRTGFTEIHRGAPWLPGRSNKTRMALGRHRTGFTEIHRGAPRLPGRPNKARMALGRHRTGFNPDQKKLGYGKNA